MKDMFKWPLLIAFVLVVGRIVSEQMGMPLTVNNLFSVAVLYVAIAPVYFALQIAKSSEPSPYKTLLKTIALFTLIVRGLFVIPTYWLAYIYQWQAPRFSVVGGGVVGPGVTPLAAFVTLPVLALMAWLVASLVLGGGIGSLIIAKSRPKAAA